MKGIHFNRRILGVASLLVISGCGAIMTSADWEVTVKEAFAKDYNCTTIENLDKDPGTYVGYTVTGCGETTHYQCYGNKHEHLCSETGEKSHERKKAKIMEDLKKRASFDLECAEEYSNRLSLKSRSGLKSPGQEGNEYCPIEN